MSKRKSAIKTRKTANSSTKKLQKDQQAGEEAAMGSKPLFRCFGASYGWVSVVVLLVLATAMSFSFCTHQQQRMTMGLDWGIFRQTKRTAGAAAAAATTPLQSHEQWDVLELFPHDNTAFTQGLTWHQNALYESTGLEGESSVRKVNLRTGEPTAIQLLPPQDFGEGIAIHNDVIHQLTYRNGQGFMWDARTLRPMGNFKFNTVTGEGWGVTCDGSHLIVSDGSDVLQFMDPKTHEEVRRVNVRLPNGRRLMRLNELEWVHGYILANVWHDTKIYRIDPETGQVLETLNFSTLYPFQQMRAEITSPMATEACLNGIAFDPVSRCLLLTGKLWPRLYRVRLKDPWWVT